MSHLCYELSPGQQQGMDLTRDIGMIAGAGSGKTRVLTERFLAILDLVRREFGADAGRALASVVAITYTRKASAEMRERIAKSCAELAQQSGSNFWNETGLKMAEARISTIHRFCASIIRDYPIEAGIEPDNLEGGTPGDIVLRAANRYCRALSGESHPLNADTGELVRLVHWNSLPELLATAFDKRSQFVPSLDNLPESPEELVAIWREKAEGLVKKIAPEKFAILKDTYKCLAEFDNTGDPNDELARIISGLCKIGGEPDSVESIFEFLDILCDDERKLRRFGHTGSGKNWPKGTIRNARRTVNDLGDAVKELMLILPAQPREADFNNARALILFARIFRGFIESEGENLPPQTEPDFVDLLIGADRIVANDSAAQDIASGLKGLLVDEFQDTDPLQWNIISRLAENLAGKLFWVGDPKQSIYRFRGADVSNVKKAGDFVRANGGRIFTLDDNYRTTPAVLNFINNMAGKFLAEPPLIDLGFHAVPQKLDRKRDIPTGHSGSVEIMISGDEIPISGPMFSENPETEMISKRIFCAVKGDEKGEGILRVDDGDGGVRPAQWGDIAVLYPTRCSMENQLRKALLGRDIPFVIIGGQSFYSSEETLAVQDLIFHLDDSRDYMALFSILRGPNFSLPDTVIYAASLAGEGDIRLGLSILADTGIKHAAKSLLSDEELDLAKECDAALSSYENRSSSMPPSRLISHILSDRGLWAYFRAQLNGEQRIANLEKMLRILSDFDSKGLSRAAEHFRSIRESEETEREEAVETEGRNAVRLMTVHQAKGLEFPVVIAANLSVRRRGATSESLIFDDYMGTILKAGMANADDNGHYYELFRHIEKERSLAETKRILYVAMTRARDHLILSGKKEGGRYLDLILEYFPLNFPESGRARDILTTEDREVEINLSVGLESWETAPIEPEAGIPGYLKVLNGEYKNEQQVFDQPIPVPAPHYHITATYLPELLNSPRENLANRIPGLQQPGGEGKEWGTLVHRFFERLPSPLPEEAEIRRIAMEVLEKRPSRVDYLVDLTRNEIIMQIFETEFDEVYREERVVLCESGFLIAGIIDRLWKDSHGWHIVDFKTDAVVGRERIEKANYYAPQLEVYRRALAKARNIEPSDIRVSILFTHDPLELVDIAPMDFAEILKKARAALDGDLPFES